MDRITVRDAEACELPQVQEMFESVYKDTFTGKVPDFAAATKGERVYVALLNDTIAGFATVWEPDAFIHFLFVDPGARHKRVGSTLVNVLAGQYDRPLTLKCLAENEDGIAFYRKTGWQEHETGPSEEGPYILFRYSGLPRRRDGHSRPFRYCDKRDKSQG